MENQPRSAMAVASLVLGIVALVTSVLPIINNLSFIMAVLGIIFAAVGLVGITKGKKSGKGLALAGLIISVIACVLVLIMQSMFSAALDEALEESGLSATTVEQTDATEDAGTVQAAPAEEKTADYIVTIDGCRLAEDYAGEPVAVVTYTFTNDSDDATSFMVAARPQAFQNGVELDTAIGDAWDNEKWMSDIKPGVSATVEIGYELEDMSDMTVEVSETFSWDGTLLAEQTFSLA